MDQSYTEANLNTARFMLPQDSSFAYLLVSHGSRDLRHQIALNNLADLVQKRLESLKKICPLRSYPIWTLSTPPNSLVSPIPIGATSLEVSPVPLSQSLEKFAHKVLLAGIKRILIMPLFLLPGVHVQEDIPHQVAIAQKKLGTSINLEICPYLGSYPQILDLLTRYLLNMTTGKTILMSHGSRHPGANQRIEEIAFYLEVITAHWSVNPSLSEQVNFLAESGAKKINILPYFLFPGGITDAIALEVQQLKRFYPHIQFNLASSFGDTPELADLIVDTLKDNLKWVHFPQPANDNLDR